MVIFYVAILLAVFYFFGFLLAIILKNNGLADVWWGLGFVLIAKTFFWSGEILGFRQILVDLFVMIWGLRLAFYIFIRSLGKGEDSRYLEMRKSWGQDWIWKSFLFVFVLQMLLMFLISSPVVVANLHDDLSFGPLQIVGVFVWLIGFVCEFFADLQMYLFKSNLKNKGKVMDRGLWKYSRHPNYFGEMLVWWGIWLLVFDLPFGWLSIIGPVTITTLLLKVSGVTLLEKKFHGNKKYREYQRRTSVFIPMPPRR